MDLFEKETKVREDPENPLALMRKEADIDNDFSKKYWMRIDMLNNGNAQNEHEQYMKY